MNNEIRNGFLKLKITGQRSAISIQDKRENDLKLIAYLKYLIENNVVVDFEDIGFCFWNISDNYAFLRDGYSLYENHKQFYEHIINNDSCYLFWLVCDATQRLALEKDGYYNFWWDLYREAVEQNSNNKLYFAEFSIHRAAFYSNKNFTFSKENINYVKRNFENFIAKTESTPENIFYKTMYSSLAARFSQIDSNEIFSLSNTLLKYLSLPQASSEYLCGEWKSFTTPFDRRRQAVVGINSAVNALIDCNDKKMAKDLYFEACNMGLHQNSYIEKRLNAD